MAQAVAARNYALFHTLYHAGLRFEEAALLDRDEGIRRLLFVGCARPSLPVASALNVKAKVPRLT